MNKKLLAITVLVVLAFSSALALASALRPTYVYDRANILDATTVSSINTFAGAVDTNSTVEIVVVTLKNLDGYGGDINTARVKIFNDESLSGVKGIGKAGKDNGVLIVMSVAGPHCGIEVGYQLEGNLTDSKCGQILDTYIMPQLKAGNYSQGMLAGVTAVAGVVAGTTSLSSGTDLPAWEIIAIVAVLIIIIIGIGAALASSDGGGDGYGGSSGGGFGGGGGGFGGGGSGGGGAGRFRRQK